MTNKVYRDILYHKPEFFFHISREKAEEPTCAGRGGRHVRRKKRGTEKDTKISYFIQWGNSYIREKTCLKNNQDLKKETDSEYVDAIFRTIIDNSADNITILLSGSSIRLMSELNKSYNPL